MTSPAIQLAKECWHTIVRMPTSETTSELYPAPASAKEIEHFYARAQAQALLIAAKKFRGEIGYNFVAADGYSSAYDIAAELEFMAEEFDK